MRRGPAIAGIALVISACGDDNSSPSNLVADVGFDAPAGDASSGGDAGGFDASAPDAGAEDAGLACDPAELPYASELVSFTPGEGAGFGEEGLPNVVLGPPSGAPGAASLDVLSLGAGGELVLGFGDWTIVDGDGPDFVVFENPFFIGGREDVFAEAIEVSVSMDGVRWDTFGCDALSDDNTEWTGCAGVGPRGEFDPCELMPVDPTQSGGDAFDLADLGVTEARFVRLRDARGDGSEPSQGADVDAVGWVHAELR